MNGGVMSQKSITFFHLSHVSLPAGHLTGIQRFASDQQTGGDGGVIQSSGAKQCPPLLSVHAQIPWF